MLRITIVITLAIVVFGHGFSHAKDDLITVTKESERVPLATGKTVSIQSLCPEKTVLIGGGGQCVGFLNTENRIVLTTSAPDSINAAWNVVCTNTNREAGDAQAKAWAVCEKH